MQVIVCEKCGGDLSWDEELGPKCLNALSELEWRGIIRSLSPDYSVIVAECRSRYPQWDELDDGAGL
jgi:RNA polymerase subunit RPABC4/transcription elongation factor Spt4